MGFIEKEKGKESYSIAKDINGSRVLFVNYFLIGEPGKGNPWVLVDAALPGSAKRIKERARDLFGENNPPQGIVLTHGHFDHVGAIEDLLESWPDVKVYCHKLEVPFLTGKSSYPPPDPTVGGGIMAYSSWIFPVKPINISEFLHVLPDNGSIPVLPDWKFIHTPGHSPGHIALFRDKDKMLLAGDAFTTTNQNSFFSVLLQKKEIHGPPAYFTINWEQSYDSIISLSALRPEAAVTGHGLAIAGKELEDGLQNLINEFDKREIPENGRYSRHPVFSDEDGIKDLPQRVSFKASRYIGVFAGVALISGLGIWLAKK